jgi:hypothetical protein
LSAFVYSLWCFGKIYDGPDLGLGVDALQDSDGGSGVMRASAGHLGHEKRVTAVTDEVIIWS